MNSTVNNGTRYAGRRIPLREKGWLGDVVSRPDRKHKKFAVHHADPEGNEQVIGFRHETDAEEFRQIILKQEKALPSHGQRRPFKDALDIAAARKAAKADNSTGSKARLHILPHFGDLDVHEITNDRYAAFLESVAHLSPTYRSQTVALFNLAIEVAKGNGWVSKDFKVEAPKPAPTTSSYRRIAEILTRRHLLPTREELIAMQAHAALTKTYLWVVVCMAINAGLRIGEMLALEWGDIDLRSRVIRVRASLRCTKVSKVKPPRKSPKTLASNRSIAINDDLFDVLTEWMGEWDCEPKKIPAGDRVLFPPGALHIPAVRVWVHFQAMLAEAGLPSFSLHALRHACVALWIWSKMDPEQMRKMIGHASQKTTLATYGYLIRAKRDGATRWPTGQAPNGDQKDAPQTRSVVVEINGRKHRYSRDIRPPEGKNLSGIKMSARFAALRAKISAAAASKADEALRGTSKPN